MIHGRKIRNFNECIKIANSIIAASQDAQNYTQLP